MKHCIKFNETYFYSYAAVRVAFFALQDTLVVHLRSGDASKRIQEWFMWSRDNVINYFETCVNHSLASGATRRVLLISQHNGGKFVHPAFSPLQSIAAANGWPLDVNGRQDIYSDFATLMHAHHVCLDYCSYSWSAVSFGQSLRTVYLPHLVNRHFGPYNHMGARSSPRGRRTAQHGIPGKGFTLPASADLQVFHIDPAGPTVEEQPRNCSSRDCT